ncbi:MAG TPA: phosphoribosylanthranilate isomerase [Rhizomicrobium sp.]|jgi:phosphoribosylanthranilate isomerase|nr:phosphoribosylanthranilate isomerase [Rhizomicrobium sp.]
MVVLVKICGINSVEAADAVIRARADFAGLNFHAKSPRAVAPEQAQSLAARMRARTKIVALMVDPSDEFLAGVLTVTRPDYVQLHGAETPARVAAIRSRFNVPVIKVLAVAEPSDFANLAAYEESADMMLFDARPPSGADRTGGHGAAFDWRILRGRKYARPWMLAGGLNAENVARAIAVSEAPGVDTASGVERAPGVKDIDKIAAFVAAARNAQYGAAA